MPPSKNANKLTYFLWFRSKKHSSNMQRLTVFLAYTFQNRLYSKTQHYLQQIFALKAILHNIFLQHLPSYGCIQIKKNKKTILPSKKAQLKISSVEQRHFLAFCILSYYNNILHSLLSGVESRLHSSNFNHWIWKRHSHDLQLYLNFKVCAAVWTSIWKAPYMHFFNFPHLYISLSI